MPGGWEAFERVEMSKGYQIKPSSRIEPVIFEPQRKIKLSRSTYKVNSFLTLNPTKRPVNSSGII